MRKISGLSTHNYLFEYNHMRTNMVFVTGLMPWEPSAWDAIPGMESDDSSPLLWLSINAKQAHIYRMLIIHLPGDMRVRICGYRLMFSSMGIVLSDSDRSPPELRPSINRGLKCHARGGGHRPREGSNTELVKGRTQIPEGTTEDGSRLMSWSPKSL